MSTSAVSYTHLDVYKRQVNHIYTKLDVHSKEELQDLLKRDSSESEPFDS